jgi:hypothetical protein
VIVRVFTLDFFGMRMSFFPTHTHIYIYEGTKGYIYNFFLIFF